jgi:hypothetical protein
MKGQRQEEKSSRLRRDKLNFAPFSNKKPASLPVAEESRGRIRIFARCFISSAWF